METFFSLSDKRTVYAAFFNYYRTGACHPDRTMTQHDFVYILEGKWNIIQNGISYEVESDDVIVLSAGAHHGGNIPCSDGTRTVYVHASAGEKEIFGLPSESDDSIPLPVVIGCRQHPEVKNIFKSMASAFASNDPYRDLRLDNLFKSLLLSLYDASKSENESKDFIIDVIKTLHDNPDRFYTSDELANIYFVSSKTLVNHFRSKTGMTPYRYQMNYKLENIQTVLISEPNRRIKDIAYDFGFYDEFHLSHAFKKQYGMSPEQYRKNKLQ